MTDPVRIGITMGDPNGIGPEVMAKALSGVFDSKLAGDDRDATWVVYGRLEPFRALAEAAPGDAGIDFKNLEAKLSEGHSAGGGRLEFRETGADEPLVVRFGEMSAHAGAASMRCLEQAVTDCLHGELDGLVTAPISKEAIALAGWPHPGHTEYLAERAGGVPVLMTMVHEGLRVALQTGHVPIEVVASKLTSESLERNLRLLSNALGERFGIESPRIAVLGLNPHAGDGGVLGSQEKQLLDPVIRGMPDAEGPFPADAFFAREMWRRFDAVLAMYHDQGLIPFKMLDEGRGVNVTLGLPFVRTSPDHGTAFDIAGRGIASGDSMKQAMRLAMSMVRRSPHDPGAV